VETRHAETVLPRIRSALTLEAPLFPTSKFPTSNDHWQADEKR
jgi:hypothetical protein